MTLICLKYFLENIISLSHHIMKEKRRKNNFPPHPTSPKKYFLKNKKIPNLPTLKNTELLLSMPPKNTTLYNSLHPKK